MKPNVVADEMFPEGAGPYMDLEEAGGSSQLLMDLAANEKSVHADFFNGIDLQSNKYKLREYECSIKKQQINLTYNNDFEDFFDDEDLQ